MPLPPPSNADATRALVAEFIDVIWNQQHLEQLGSYLHPAYVDHSLPAGLTPDQAGLRAWIEATGRSFQHHTRIDDQLTEGDKSVVKITMLLTHFGEWRGIAATGRQVQTAGYRQYRVADGQIIEHWAAIDGTVLESALRQQNAPVCQVPE